MCDCENVPVVVDYRLQYIGLSEGILETWRNILKCGVKYTAYQKIVGVTEDELNTAIGYLDAMIIERQADGESLYTYMPSVTTLINKFVNHQICL